MNLIDVTQLFKNDDDCLAYLESMRWPDGIRCPVCGCNRMQQDHAQDCQQEQAHPHLSVPRANLQKAVFGHCGYDLQ